MGHIMQNYQKDVLQAIFKEANELGYTVFCFANFGAYGDKVGSSTLAQPQNPYKPQKCGIFLSNFLKLYVVWRCVLCYNEV